MRIVPSLLEVLEASDIGAEFGGLVVAIVLLCQHSEQLDLLQKIVGIRALSSQGVGLGQQS